MGAVRSELVALREMLAKLLAQSGERPRLYEFKAAAKLLGVHPKTVSKMVAHGELLPVSVRGKRMIPVEEIDRACSPPSMKSSGASPERAAKDGKAARARLKELRRR